MPANQPWACLLSPYSAVPVFPPRPLMSRRLPAVPDVTASRIADRMAVATGDPIADGSLSAVVAMPWIRTGVTVFRAARDASTSAIPNGDAVTRPCPIPLSTLCASESADGTFPVIVVSPGTE